MPQTLKPSSGTRGALYSLEDLGCPSLNRVFQIFANTLIFNISHNSLLEIAYLSISAINNNLANYRHSSYKTNDVNISPTIPSAQVALPIVAAFSGGPDSSILALCLCLLPLMQIFAQQNNAINNTSNAIISKILKILQNSAPEIFITFVHIDHNLRPESPDEATSAIQNLKNVLGTAEKMLQKFSLALPTIEICSIQLIKESLGRNIQESARNARYSILSNILTEKKKILRRSAIGFITDGFVATGHTADDSAETILLNLFRGSGIDGLCGIDYFSQMENFDLHIKYHVIQKENVYNANRESNIINTNSHYKNLHNIYSTYNQHVQQTYLLRPLITICKTDIIEALNALQLPYVIDSSNVSIKYMRNYIRSLIADISQKMQINTNTLHTRILQTGGHLQQIHRIINNEVGEIISNNLYGFFINGCWICMIDAYDFYSLQEEIALRVLLRMLDQAQSNNNKISRHIKKTRFSNLQQIYCSILDTIHDIQTIDQNNEQSAKSRRHRNIQYFSCGQLGKCFVALKYSNYTLKSVIKNKSINQNITLIVSLKKVDENFHL